MSVYLYVVRHGEATPYAKKDALRELTEHGRLEAKQTAAWLKDMAPVFDKVLVSPYIRAQQTLEVIAQFGPDFINNEIYDGLTPDSEASTAIDYLLAQFSDSKREQHILCVSHMPLVSYLIGELTGYTPLMATAGVAQLEIDLDKWQGRLISLLSPDQIV